MKCPSTKQSHRLSDASSLHPRPQILFLAYRRSFAVWVRLVARESHPVGNVASVVALPPCTRLFSTHRGYVDHVFKTERATPHGTHRLATRDGMGANDDIVSTASLVLGVAAAHATHSNILIAGVAGLVVGAMSMLPANMCLFTHRRTPNRPILRLSARN